MRASFLIRGWSLALCALVVGCGSSNNTPEQAFADLRTALKEKRWDLLYDLLPPAKQADFDVQIAAIDEEFEAAKKEVGDKVVDAQLKRDFGITLAEWKQLDKKHRMAKIWGRSATEQLVQLGINPAEIETSTVKETRIVGDKAEISLDDGKGHRSRLTFVLVEGYWRFDLEKGG